MFDIWLIEENGDRQLVRGAVDEKLKNALMESANHGAQVRGLGHRYEAVPAASGNVVENTVAPSTDIDVLRAALKDAEDELCNMGHTLVSQGWDTGTIALTIDVIRIALYGTDGAGNGPEGFKRAQERLAALRAEEAALAH